MEYGCESSFVGRRSTTAETTTTAAAAHLGITTYMFFCHILARYLSEGSVQQHPPPYSFRKRVLARPVMRHFFPWKTKKKKARFARAPHDNIFLRALRYTYSLWQHPGESPTYILHKDKTIFCVKLST